MHKPAPPSPRPKASHDRKTTRATTAPQPRADQRLSELPCGRRVNRRPRGLGHTHRAGARIPCRRWNSDARTEPRSKSVETGMRLAEARRLKPGTKLIFADCKFTGRAVNRWKGKVIFVTPKGGIRVQVLDEAPWYGDANYCSYERWVPYHHVWRVIGDL
jgi:hypothetical protein